QSSAANRMRSGGPSCVLPVPPNTRRYVSGFLRRALHFALPNAVVVTLGVVGINLYARVADSVSATTEEIQTSSFIVLVLLGLWILCVGSRPLTRARLGLLLLMYVLLVVVLSVPWSLLYHEFQTPQADLLWAALIVSAVGSALIELNFRLHSRWLRLTQREAYDAAVRAGQV
ncbi:cation-translocating P-type ATPase, partial [Rothia sp. AR01]|nr:cation-translocating P-type ATPase [Rothia santali]